MARCPPPCGSGRTAPLRDRRCPSNCWAGGSACLRTSRAGSGRRRRARCRSHPGMCGRPSASMLKPLGQEQHVGVGAKDGPRRAGAGHASLDGDVETLHALLVENVRTALGLHAGNRIIVGGHPAVVAGQQSLEKCGAFFRATCLPSASRPGPPARRREPWPCRSGSRTCRRRSRGRVRRPLCAGPAWPCAIRPRFRGRGG